MGEHVPSTNAPEADETDDVDAHGLKEVAVTGLSAAALIAGAGTASAATALDAKAPMAKQAVFKVNAVDRHLEL